MTLIISRFWDGTKRVCVSCSREFQSQTGHRRLCVRCVISRRNARSRKGMRKSRDRRKLIRDDSKCQVCGYSEVVDTHHEGQDLYILCPNHHTLITRNKKQIEEYSIKTMMNILHSL